MNNKNFKVVAGFIFLNFIISFLLGLQYFGYIGTNPLEIVYAATAYLSNMFTIYSLLFASAGIFYLVCGPGRILKYLLVILFFIVNIIVLTDVGIYKIFRFHINGLVINTMLTSGGWESLEFNPETKIYFVLVIIFALVLELYLYEWLKNYIEKTGFVIRKSRILICVIFMLTVVAADKGIFAYGDLYDIQYITRHVKLFPLYQPLTIKRFAVKHFNIIKKDTLKFKIDRKNSGIIYPKNNLRFDNNKKEFPNIIVILLDSFRYDMMNADVTPNIYKFSKDALRFNNHYSGGNCSRFGVFSFFYGIYGYYWHIMLGERRPPVLMDALSDLGYDFKLLASAKLTFPEFNKTCFENVNSSSIFDEPRGKTKSDNDSIITDELIKYINGKKDKKPYFAFLFLDCPHGSYDFPPDFEKFKPTVPSFNYLTLNKDNVLPVFNRYKNSIYYNDYLVGKVIANLKKRGMLEKTVLIISADHGEAFFEKGFYGHNRGFCEEQIKVPLVFYIPGVAPEQYEKLTSHMDITPTLMSIIGCKNDYKDFANGEPLLLNSRRDFIVSSTWDELAIVDDKKFTIVVPVESYNISGIKVYDADYREIIDKKIINSVSPHLIKLQKNTSYFLK